MHAYDACISCMHIMHAYYACMHTMHAYYAYMHIMHAHTMMQAYHACVLACIRCMRAYTDACMHACARIHVWLWQLAGSPIRCYLSYLKIHSCTRMHMRAYACVWVPKHANMHAWIVCMHPYASIRIMQACIISMQACACTFACTHLMHACIIKCARACIFCMHAYMHARMHICVHALFMNEANYGFKQLMHPS